MDAERFDRAARIAGTRRTFVAAAAALVVGLVRLRPAGAQGVCSSHGGVCAPGLACCSGHGCNYEFNTWVGRCGRINEEGLIAPIETTAGEWALRVTDRATLRRERLERRRRARRDRRKNRRD
jgi:hypothetical protein